MINVSYAHFHDYKLQFKVIKANKGTHFNWGNCGLKFNAMRFVALSIRFSNGKFTQSVPLSSVTIIVSHNSAIISTYIRVSSVLSFLFTRRILHAWIVDSDTTQKLTKNIFRFMIYISLQRIYQLVPHGMHISIRHIAITRQSFVHCTIKYHIFCWDDYWTLG